MREGGRVREEGGREGGGGGGGGREEGGGGREREGEGGRGRMNEMREGEMERGVGEKKEKLETEWKGRGKDRERRGNWPIRKERETGRKGQRRRKKYICHTFPHMYHLLARQYHCNTTCTSTAP